MHKFRRPRPRSPSSGQIVAARVRLEARNPSARSISKKREQRSEKEIAGDGEDAGEDEGGGVRAIAVPAEGDAGAVEGHHHQDPPQGLRELALRHPPPQPPRRNLLVSTPLLPFVVDRSIHVLLGLRFARERGRDRCFRRREWLGLRVLVEVSL